MKGRKEEAWRIDQFVKIMRLQQGWTQQELADRAHMQQDYVSQIEQGNILPTKRVASRLAQAFGVVIDMFLSNTQYPRRAIETPGKTANSFGALIAQARVKKGWSRSYLEGMVAVGRGVIAAYESAGKYPRDRTVVEQLADALEIDKEQLLAVWEPKVKTVQERALHPSGGNISVNACANPQTVLTEC